MSDAHHKLVDDLRGLVDAAELHDQQVIDDFNQHLARLDSEYELRTEPWAPPNSADDEALEADLRGFREWRWLFCAGAATGICKALGRLPAEDGRRRRPPAGPALSQRAPKVEVVSPDQVEQIIERAIEHTEQSEPPSTTEPDCKP